MRFRRSALFLSVSLSLLLSVSLSKAAFDSLGYGAAGKAMGGAYTALAEEGAAYWNPAALDLIRRPQLAAAYEDLFGLGLFRYTTLGYNHPHIGGGTLGIHLLRLSSIGEAS